jgi:hypothetical protein
MFSYIKEGGTLDQMAPRDAPSSNPSPPAAPTSAATPAPHPLLLALERCAPPPPCPPTHAPPSLLAGPKLGGGLIPLLRRPAPWWSNRGFLRRLILPTGTW